jgi:hypothetical protein
MVLRLTTVEFLELGLEIAEFGGQRQRSVKIKIRRFRKIDRIQRRDSVQEEFGATSRLH